MTWLLFLATAAAGGVGAAFRFFLDGMIRSRLPQTFPYGTAVINVTGSFALGLITGLAQRGGLPVEAATLIGVGLLGGYTTFSTASVETVRLAHERRYRAAATNGLGVLIGGTLAAVAGLWLGGLGTGA